MCNALFASILDAYNIIIIPQSPSSYYEFIGIRLKTIFEEKGFQVYLNQTWDEVPKEFWYKSLKVSWEVEPNYNGPSQITIKLKDSNGITIQTYIETGMAIFSIASDIKIALNKVERIINNTEYNFKEPDVDTSKFKTINLNEDSVRNYLVNNIISDFEGIYKSFGDNWYRFAIIKQESRYVAFILETANVRFKPGDIKAYFEPVKRNLFSTTYIMGDKTTKETISTIDDGMLKVVLGNNNDFVALKLFPTDENTNSSTITTRDGHWKSSGSGFFISDRIVATNYHVVKNANNIKIIVKNNSEVNSYIARVLATDNTNDLALVSITDKEFKGVQSIPYSLFFDTKEVGTSVFTMGYPMSDILGNEIKITDGIISSKTGYKGDIVTYQITAPTQPGNSGGALFDKNGVLIGITNAGVPSAENVGYAIKTIYLKNLIEAAPIYIELPKGQDLAGKELTELVKILSPYMVFVEIY